MIGVRDKLKSFEIPFLDSFIIKHTFNSLPLKFSQLKTVFNTQNESWTLDELVLSVMLKKTNLKGRV